MNYDWIMALLALASAPALLLGSRRLVGGIRAYQKKVRQCSSRLMAYESETFHNLDAGFTAAASASGRRNTERPVWTPICSASAHRRRFRCLAPRRR